ncbi:hypothetical protein J2X41_003225 [Caulobacter sp. BE254]|nr:hypothetical protein [Caulobacter sp. BE254]
MQQDVMLHDNENHALLVAKFLVKEVRQGFREIIERRIGNDAILPILPKNDERLVRRLARAYGQPMYQGLHG